MKHPYPTLLYSAPDVDYPGTHGGSTHVGEAVASFSKLCRHVYVICARKAKQPYYERKENITYLRIPVLPFSPLRIFSYFFFPFCLSFFLAFFGKITLIYERARIFGGGAIFAGNLLGYDTVYEMIEPYVEVPVILGQIKKHSFLHRLLKRWHKEIVNRSTLVTVTHSSFLQDIPSEKVYFIHTGANPRTFHDRLPVKHLVKKYSLTKGKTLLYVGSFTRWHACEHMIKAAALAIAKDKQVKFLMLGKGQQYATCASLIRKLGVSENILLLGKVPFKQIPTYINAADICFALFDRNYPPFKQLDYYYSPIKIHEYKSCGKAIIASNIGTLKQYVADGKNGYLVSEAKVSEIAKAITKLLGNKRQQRSMGKRNRQEVVNTYNWETANRNLLKKLMRL